MPGRRDEYGETNFAAEFPNIARHIKIVDGEVEGLQESAFQEYLIKFRLVRGSDYKKDWSKVGNTPSSDGAKQQTDAQVANVVTSETWSGPSNRATEQENVFVDGNDFWTGLNEFLLIKFENEEKADRIATAFQENYCKMLRNLSLDDIELLATILGSRPKVVSDDGE